MVDWVPWGPLYFFCVKNFYFSLIPVKSCRRMKTFYTYSHVLSTLKTRSRPTLLTAKCVVNPTRNCWIQYNLMSPYSSYLLPQEDFNLWNANCFYSKVTLVPCGCHHREEKPVKNGGGCKEKKKPRRKYFLSYFHLGTRQPKNCAKVDEKVERKEEKKPHNSI